MNILIYKHDHTFSLDKIIIPYFTKKVQVFTIGKKEADFTINSNDFFSKKDFLAFIEKHKITHFFYCENNTYIPPILDLLFSNITTVMMLTDTNTGIKKRIPYVKLFDIVFLICTQHIPLLKKYNQHIYPIQYGVDTTYFYKKKNVTKKYDVSFVGNIVPWVHYERYFLMLYLRLRGIKIHYTTAPYKKINDIFNESRIVLNKTPLKGFNMRIFEVMGSGSLLLNDYCRENGMTRIFKDKKHLVYYKSFNDCYKKITYYLQHKKKREVISEEGNQFAKQQYSWDKQIDKIVAVLKNYHSDDNAINKDVFFNLAKIESNIFRNNKKAQDYLKKAYTVNEINRYTYNVFSYFYLLKNAFIQIFLKVITLLYAFR